MRNMAYQRVFDQFKRITRTRKNEQNSKIKKTLNGYKFLKTQLCSVNMKTVTVATEGACFAPISVQ